MMKFTKHNLKKLETLFEELDYAVRYERGNFQAGYCLVENNKVAVINRYFDTESRINCLLDMLGSLDVSKEKLSEPSLRFYRQILKAGEGEAEEQEENSQA